MRYTGLTDFLSRSRALLAKGPVAVIVIEDRVEVESTLRHHLKAGFRAVIALAPEGIELPEDLADSIHAVSYAVHGPGALTNAVNTLIEAAPGTWFYYCYNTEYLFHPFCETRNIRELITFQTEERRDAVLSYVVDLYAEDLLRFPDAVSVAEACLDRSGYYALGRNDPANHNHPKERQLNFFGGLRWRFEEHIPPARRKIDRIALFKAKTGLKLRDDYTFNDEEYNTYACPWHNNITTATMSFRTAKALRTNPGSRDLVPSFRWYNTERFDWTSVQLMNLGLMEPGQWF
jgi:hypothetical protein